MKRPFAKLLAGSAAFAILTVALPMSAQAQDRGARVRSERSSDRMARGVERRAQRDATMERRGERRAERRSDRRMDRRANVRSDRRDRRADARQDRRLDARLDRREERVRERARDVRRAERRIDSRILRHADRGNRHYDRRDQRRRVIVRPRANYIYRPHFWGTRVFLWDDRYRGYGYDRHYRAGYGYYGPTSSSGWRILYPWLKDESAARHWVMWQFDANRDGWLGKSEARRANREFERLADYDRDGRLSRWEIDEGLYELRDEYRYAFR